jgi:hypothetical protein
MLGYTFKRPTKHAEWNAPFLLWIDTAREFGDPIPEPKGERLMLA